MPRPLPDPSTMPTGASRIYNRCVSAALALVAPLMLGIIALHVLWGALAAGLLFPLLPARKRDALVRFWSQIALVALGIRLELHHHPGAAPIAATRGSLLLINHTSWADVFVVAAVTPARFVAKSDIERWPLLGRFAASVGTVFIERGRRHAVAHVNHAVRARLQAGQSVGIFPEGTTTDGSVLLRFHSNMVQAALEAQAPVVPLGVRYVQDGRPTAAAAFIGEMTLAGSMWRILVTPRLTAQLYWLPAIVCAGQTRQAIAGHARDAIAAALGFEQERAAPPEVAFEVPLESPTGGRG